MEKKVQILEQRLSELETDWSLFITTPDRRWIFPNNNVTPDRNRKGGTKK